MSMSGVRNSVLAFIILFPFWGTGQVRVSQLTDSAGQNTHGGLIYNLPRTGLLVEISVVKTIKERGMFYEYAKEFLGIDNVISRNTVDYDISEVKVTTFSKPDPEQFYLVEGKRQFPWLNKRKALVNLSPEGYLLSYKHPFKANAPGESVNSSDHLPIQVQADAKQDQAFYHINDALLSGKNNNVKVDSSIRLPLRRPVYKVENKDIPLIERARIALETMAGLRENLQNLAGGYQEVAYESGTMNLMIEQLIKQESELLKQFTGISREETLTYTFSYIPAGYDTIIETIAWFNKQSGILSHPIDNSSPIGVRLEPVSIPDAGEQEKVSKRPPQGIAYRLPAVTECTVYLGDDPKFKGQRLISQYGRTIRLPKQLKKAVFYPETGSLKSFK
ncbi:MAG: DUF4831 family protein [Bacteroidales bacterium]